MMVDPDHRVETLRSRAGMILKSFNLLPHLTALENAMLAPVHVQFLQSILVRNAELGDETAS
jgi:ABC-type histidine transport system ATPase subunit